MTMVKINSSKFGSVTINGKQYVIELVFPRFLFNNGRGKKI